MGIFSRSLIFFFVFASCWAQEVKICLVLGMENDQLVLQRSLRSLGRVVDCIAAVDLESTDRSQEVLTEFALEQGIPLHVECAENPTLCVDREFSLEFARAFVRKLGYALDSTYFLVWEPDLELRLGEGLQKDALEKDAYLVLQRSARLKLFHYGTRLLKASKEWHRHGVIYPYYVCSEAVETETLTSIEVCDMEESRYATEKLRAAAIELEKAVAVDPQNARNWFYLAEVYKAEGLYREAVSAYEARGQLGGDREELWFCKFRAGQCFEELGEWERALGIYLEAFQLAPERPETLYRIAHYYRVLGKNELAYLFARHGMRIPYPSCVKWSVHPQLEGYQFLEEVSIAAYYTRFREEGFAANNALILKRGVPWYIRDQAYRNLQFYVEPLAEAQYVPIEIELPIVEGEERYHPMNPSICRTKEGYEVVLRSVNYTQVGAKVFNTNDPSGIIRTRNFLVSMDRQFHVVSQAEILDDPFRYRQGTCGVEGLEDCRLFPFEGGWWFSCTTADTSDYGTRQISLCQLGRGEGEETLEVVGLTPLLGPDPARCEKNWLPFVVGGTLYMLYSCDPLVIYQPDPLTGECNEALSCEVPIDASRFRGSAAPIPFDGGYLFLVHETVVNPDYHRVYYHRFVKLDPLFRMEAISQPFIFRHVGIEFSCGMAWDHTGRELVLGVGIEDREAYLCRVPAASVRSLLKSLAEK